MKIGERERAGEERERESKSLRCLQKFTRHYQQAGKHLLYEEGSRCDGKQWLASSDDVIILGPIAVELPDSLVLDSSFISVLPSSVESLYN